jgi:hypothetical protein
MPQEIIVQELSELVNWFIRKEKNRKVQQKQKMRDKSGKNESVERCDGWVGGGGRRYKLESWFVKNVEQGLTEHGCDGLGPALRSSGYWETAYEHQSTDLARHVG